MSACLLYGSSSSSSSESGASYHFTSHTRSAKNTLTDTHTYCTDELTEDHRHRLDPDAVCDGELIVRLIYPTSANLIKEEPTKIHTVSHTLLNLQSVIRLGAKQETGSVWNCGEKSH